jgi:AcrR family transcriptional regulator
MSKSAGRGGPRKGEHLPPLAAAQGTRARILEAGLGLFAARGFHATSIRDIAAAAGMQSASLYSHFVSKEAILADLVLLGNEEHNRRVVAAVLEAGPKPTDQLTAVVRAHVLAHTQYPRLALVANYELHNLAAEVAAPALAVRDRSSAILREVLERGVREGVFDLIDLDATALAIATMGTSVAMWWPPADASMTAELLAEHYAALALRMASA